MNKLLLCLLFLPLLHAWAKTDHYRVAWRDDPSTSMVIGWNQISGENPIVFYGTEDKGQNITGYEMQQKPDRIKTYREMENHFVRLTNLKPDTAYYFVIQDSDSMSQRLWFRTAPDKPKPFTFITGGDSRSQAGPRRRGNQMVAKLRPLFILFGGDYTGQGSPKEWKEWLSDWQLTISEDGRIYPIIATHGNHENADQKMMTHLFDTQNPDQYYSFSVGGDMMHIWVLNSELEYKVPEKVDAQNEWIKKDLAKYKKTKWKIASYHRPMRPHTSSKSEGTNRIKWWADLFYKQGIDLIIESDTHMVKRSYPVRPSTGKNSYESFERDDTNGMTFIGEGSWGAPPRPADDNKPWTMASDSFNQYKWVLAYPDELLIRTVRFDNPSKVEALTEDNLFQEPKNMQFWEPETGKVLRLPFDAKHPTYSEPRPKTTLFPLENTWSWSLDGKRWRKGTAPFGYGHDRVKTPIDDQVTHPNIAHFKADFSVVNSKKFSQLFLDVLIDDGCIIKLNGKEVLRYNIKETEDGSDAVWAQNTISEKEKTAPLTIRIPSTSLKKGRNTLEVQVFQVSAKSSDLFFDLGIRAN